MTPVSPTPTVLLDRLDDPDAVEALFPLVYDELRQIAHRQLVRRGRPGETLNTTGLVHEAYLKLADAEHVSWENRTHFYALSARVMRQVLLNYARDRQALKRGGHLQRATFDDALAVASDRAETLIDFDRALDALAEVDERMSRVVEMRFFGGLTEKEIGHVLDVSPRTVRREWRQAKAWLARSLAPCGGEDTTP